MAVEKVFWQDPYLSEIEARVTSVNGSCVTLDRTVAYAFSGGQQSDSGTIGGYEILKAQKEGREIVYALPEDHGLVTGSDVTVKIDWEKRYALMRLHFAAEIILELVYQNYGYPEKAGANITPDKARVDFFWEGSISRIFPALLDDFNRMVASDLDIESGFSDRENEIRYWQIEGFARVPCGGTHLRKTGEVGAVSLKRDNIGKGKERIEIYLL